MRPSLKIWECRFVAENVSTVCKTGTATIAALETFADHLCRSGVGRTEKYSTRP